MNRLTSLILILLFISLTIAKSQNPIIAFKSVNVIPMTGTDLIMQDQTVIVSDGIIQELGNKDEINIPPEALIIEGAGNFLIPGLAEMHAHIPPLRQGEPLIEETLFLYVSNGITTIRGMLGEPFHLELKDKVAKGNVFGPRIFTSGPSLNGNSVKSVEQAKTKVLDQKKAGYDFLKLHPGIKLEVFDAIAETAKEAGIPYSGHVSIYVGIRHALESQYASIDHVDGFVEGLVPASEKVDPSENGFFGINFTDLADINLINELAALTKKQDVWIVPTQSLLERWVGTEDPEVLSNDPEMKYMNKATVSRWISTKQSYISNPVYSKDLVTRFIELRQEIIKSLRDHGAGILLGSDAPQVFNVPGFSIQNELESMVRCGLTPYEALEAGTANPAKFFGEEGNFGTIEEGAAADLILLYDNPLDNISNTRNQKGVMVRGSWLSSLEISTRLEAIALKYGSEE